MKLTVALCNAVFPSRPRIDLKAALEKETPLGAYLDEQELQRLARLCTSASVRPHRQLPDSPFYLVTSGDAVILNQDGSVLCTRTRGAFFSRRAGVALERRDGSFHKGIRTSIITSSGFDDEGDSRVLTTIVGGPIGVNVLYVDRNQLDTFVKEHCSSKSRDIILRISRSNISAQLSEVPFIADSGLQPAELRSLGEICHYATFAPGTCVFHQGDRAENFYIILKGCVDITIRPHELLGHSDEHAALVTAVARRVGDSFGVAALVHNAPFRTYSATASERTLCLVISRTNFEKFIAVNQSLADALLLTTKRFLLQRYRSMGLPIVSTLDDNMLEEVARLAKFENVAKGQDVYRQGDLPTAFYVVLHGTIECHTKPSDIKMDGDSKVPLDAVHRESIRVAQELISDQCDKSWTLSMGHHFGEVGLLMPRTMCISTCTAVCQSTLLKIDAGAFVSLFGANPHMLADMKIKLLRERVPLHGILQHSVARAKFAKQLEAEYATESLFFYEAVTAVAASSASLKTSARSLINEFIVEGAPQQVNIPSDLQKQLASFNEGAIDEHTDEKWLKKLLMKAQAETYMLMSRDSLPRFVKSAPFQAMLADMGSYSEVTASLISEENLAQLAQDGAHSMTA